MRWQIIFKVTNKETFNDIYSIRHMPHIQILAECTQDV